MEGVSKEVKNTPSIGVIIYFLGVLFLVMSLWSVILHAFIEGLLFILAAILTIFLASSQLKKKINTSIPGFVIFFVVFFLVVVAIIAFPVTPTVINNNTNEAKVITAPLSEVNDSKIAVSSRLTSTLSSKPTPTTTSIEATMQGPTTSEATKYQDSKWLTTCVSGITQVNADIKSLTNAAKNYDTMSLSKYADTLYTDSQIAGENSDLCNVSPDLQGSKDEYRSAMLQANKVAVYANSGVEAYNNRNFVSLNSNVKQATECVKSYNEHIKKAVKLSKNSKPTKN